MRSALRLSFVATVFALAVAVHAPVRAQDACSAVVNGRPVGDYSFDAPLQVTPGETLDLEATVVDPDGEARVSLDVVVRVPLRTIVVEREQSFRGQVTLEGLPEIGNGPRHVVVESGGCTFDAWVRVANGSVAGGSAVGVAAGAIAAAGAALQLRSIVGAIRGTRGLRGQVFAAIPTGVGSCLLAQELGWVPASATSLASFTGLPMIAGTALQGVLSRRPRRVPAHAGALSAAGPEDEPPRSSYALLDAPGAVVAAQELEVLVGLSPERVPGVSAARMVVPDSVAGDYTLTVQLVADGFTIRDGESWRVSMPVTGAEPYPRVAVHLTPDPQGARVVARVVHALYSVEGHTMGMASRATSVVRSAELLDEAESLPAGLRAMLSAPTSAETADLTICILNADEESNGKLRWTFDSPRITVPDVALVSEIGRQPDAFAQALITEVHEQEGRPGLYQKLKGIGRRIAGEVPPDVWEVLGEVARAVGRTPTVLLLVQEAYIPWELAVLKDEHLIDPDVPPFLSTQVTIGRWMLGDEQPIMPPPAGLDVRAMAVVCGIYEGGEWQRLDQAEQEASELQRTYGAVGVNATTEDVLACLNGPRADLLHFAVHGTFDPSSQSDAVVLTDGGHLDEFMVGGADFTKAPFVFLNACQVGQGRRLLGNCSGLAQSFLERGAAAVVAPLWSVNDELAKDLALGFYQRVFAGDPVAEVFRDHRRSFGSDSMSATSMAYQLYGHPSLRLQRVAAGEIRQLDAQPAGSAT